MSQTNSTSKSFPFHASPINDIVEHLGTNLKGLSDQEVTTRLEKWGPNALTPPPKRNAFLRFLAQFQNVLIYILLAAATITFFLGHYIDTIVIFAVVIINALIGFIQEGKAEKALDSIKNLLSTEITVRRNGKKSVIPAKDLVPGDIMLLYSGDKIPADARLFEVHNFHNDESILTGESVPSKKFTDVISAQASLGDRKNMVFSGTLVTQGQAEAIVTTTGDSTELGKINDMIRSVEQLTTPLLQKINEFSHALTLIILGLAGVTFAFGFFIRDYTVVEMFVAAIGLMVAAIPEGLPAIITITLAIGVQQMAKRKSIIRRLPAVETLGSVSVICSDKTGTLTKNEMTAVSIITAQDSFEITGTGYQPTGEIQKGEHSFDAKNHSLLEKLAHGSLLCSDSELVHNDNLWSVSGDPTEGALVVYAEKAGFDSNQIRELYKRLDIIPFESEHKFMATLNRGAENSIVWMKGAPEVVLKKCTHAETHSGDLKTIDTDFWNQKIQEQAQNGRRTLAVAYKKLSDGRNHFSDSDTDGDFILLGVFGIIDPPRPEAITAISDCKAAGIRVKMITGDHAITALAIAKEMGITDKNTVLTGQEIEQFSDEELLEKVSYVNVFARVNPEHKLRIVEALQKRGEITAMTGDGVNDAPALKRSNIGIAMGVKGTEAAKEASEMVLVDDNFATIVAAVEQGRIVYQNIKKSILFIIPTNGGEALTLVLAILLGLTLPMTPVQILWVNMITAVTLALALSFEPGEKLVMKHKPRPPQEALLSWELLMRVAFVSLIILIGTFGIFYVAFEIDGHTVERSRTMAVNTLVLFEVFYLLNSRRILESSFTLNILTQNKYVIYAISLVIVFQMLFTYNGFFQSIFQTEAINLQDWIQSTLVASSVFFLVEIEKFFRRKRQSKI